MTRAAKVAAALERCPCCGETAVFGECTDEDSVDFGGRYIACSNRQCGLTTVIMFPIMESVDEHLAERWNRRILREREANPPSSLESSAERDPDCPDCGGHGQRAVIVQDSNTGEAREDSEPCDCQPAMHEWVQRAGFDWAVCAKCDIVRRADDANGPCRGRVHIGLRQPAAPAVGEDEALLEEAERFCHVVAANGGSGTQELVDALATRLRAALADLARVEARPSRYEDLMAIEQLQVQVDHYRTGMIESRAALADVTRLTEERDGAAVGEDEALLAEAQGFAATDLERRLATRLRAALADLARVRWELATEKDYTQSAYLAAREAGEACGRAMDERNEARAALAAAVRSVAKRACEATAEWAMEDPSVLSPEWIESGKAGKQMNAIIDGCVAAEEEAIRARAGRNDAG